VKKYILFLLSLFIFANADALDDNIATFMDAKKYESSKNLIRFLFVPRENYYKNGAIDTLGVIKTLNKNGLLSLYSKEPKDVELVFYIDFNPLISLKVIHESLTSMGYSFFLTKKMAKSSNGLEWHIDISTQHVPNPIVLEENLRQRGCFIEDITKNENRWSYKINTQNTKIDALKLQKNIQHELTKPFSAYWVKLDSVEKVIIRSHIADYWYPKVTFYDEGLNFLNKIEESDKKAVLNVSVPKKAHYIKIEDRYTLDNIKRGIKITLE